MPELVVLLGAWGDSHSKPIIDKTILTAPPVTLPFLSPKKSFSVLPALLFRPNIFFMTKTTPAISSTITIIISRRMAYLHTVSFTFSMNKVFSDGHRQDNGQASNVEI